jgi:serine/threonine-protein kinase
MEPTNRTSAGDQYSLGCILYYCLAGCYPHPEGSAVEKMMAHQFKQPTPLTELAPDTPPELVAVIETLLQKKPEDRFSGFDALVESLTPLVSSLPSTTFDALATQAVLSKSRVPGLPKRKSNTPGLMPGSRVPGMPKGKSSIPGIPAPRSTQPESPGAPLGRRSGHGTVPAKAEAAAPAPQIPNRRLLRGQPAPAPVPATPMIPPPVSSPARIIPQAELADQKRRPTLGPIGFISIGALVAVMAFLLFQFFLK